MHAPRPRLRRTHRAPRRPERTTLAATVVTTICLAATALSAALATHSTYATSLNVAASNVGAGSAQVPACVTDGRGATLIPGTPDGGVIDHVTITGLPESCLDGHFVVRATAYGVGNTSIGDGTSAEITSENRTSLQITGLSVAAVAVLGWEFTIEARAPTATNVRFN